MNHPEITPRNDNDEILFADAERESESPGEEKVWKVMIVDDDEEVHAVTKMVLGDFIFLGKSLTFVSAYSGEAAKQRLQENPDTAVILLDVVMETEDAGLQAARYIREELKNSFVRIILRTGYPGQAPERSVIIDYDINDYKEKTELTAQKLHTTLIAALRSYRDLKIIDGNRQGLQKIIEASPSIFKFTSIDKFSSGILQQLSSLINLDTNTVYCKTSGFTAIHEENDFRIIAATGDYVQLIHKRISEAVPAMVLEEIEEARKGKNPRFINNNCLSYFRSQTGSENLLYIEGINSLSDWDKYLIEVFCTNVSVAYDNIYLNQEIEDTQKETIFTLGEIIEGRSRETGNHVKRVSEYSRVLASKFGLNPIETEIVRLASPMHDVGKIAIPDAILNKPGKLTEEEFLIIQTHSALGYQMLKSSNRNILKSAGIIAFQHHEKYNGTGYPNGLKGEEIHLYGRITALADVFDALSSDRIYRPSWEIDKVLDLIKKEKNEHFDPILADLFFENLDEILAIKETYRDQYVQR